MKRLKSYKVKNKRFFISFELNPLTNELDPHIWIRHLIEPHEAIKAWFKISTQEFNSCYDRYEAYSEDYQLNIYYAFMNNDSDKVLIISAFR